MDSQTRLTVANDVHEIIKTENKGVAMITHDVAEAISLYDKVIVLSNRPSTIKDAISIDIDKQKPSLKRRND